MPGFLGDVRSFQRHWRKPIEVNGETLRAQALARRVRPFILRRRKEDVATELPPVTEVIRRVPLLGQQRTLYECAGQRRPPGAPRAGAARPGPLADQCAGRLAQATPGVLVTRTWSKG